MFDRYLKSVVEGDYLNSEEAYLTARMLLHEDIPEIKAAAFLSALRTRKESQEELTGFVQALYEEAKIVDCEMEVLDTCGTGGDGLGTFNISTASALVVASCGVAVAKHGNRAVTGKVGSADVLEALGVGVQLEPDEARQLLDKAGITFLFAPHYHPILKQVGGLRRGLGIATIFNFLGPLLNPCRPSYQVLGISDSNLQEAVAGTLQRLGRKRALVVHAFNGMDEISPKGKTRVFDVGEHGLEVFDIDPLELGIGGFSLDAIQGGDATASARLVIKVLQGEPGPYRDTVILNTAAALLTAGRAKDMQEGMQMAAEAIDAGKSMETLQKMISFSRDRVLAC